MYVYTIHTINYVKSQDSKVYQMLITKKTTINVVLQVHMALCIHIIYNHFLIRTYLTFINKQCRQVDSYF